MQRTAELPGEAYFDGAQTLAPIANMRPYKDNPRDPRDFRYELSSDFRSLVQSIDKVGVTNPLQVFWQDGGFEIIAGHRRLAAVHEINRQRMEAWEKAGKPGKAPEVIKFVPASIQKAPTSSYERHVAMWNAEETKADWPESRKFKFFCATYDAAPPSLQGNVKDLASELGMKQSTVRTYLDLRAVPELSRTMADPSETRMPRAGRHKTLRAMARLIDEAIEKRPTAVRIATGLSPSDDKTKDLLAAKLFSKYQIYNENPRLGVGPGVALERTVPLVSTEHQAAVSDAEFVAWLSDSSVLRQDVIEQRSARQLDDAPDESILERVRGIGLRVRPGRLDEDELQLYADDLTAAADYLAGEARKARLALQEKLGR